MESQMSDHSSRGSLQDSMFSKAALSQRIVNVEHYMAAPVKEYDNMYSEFRNSSVKRVPVIRIFGATPAGQKMCANIHGVYPYISVLDDETVAGFEYRIASALDNAINDSVNSNKFRSGGYNADPPQHVFKVIRVVGRTFYGYRSNNEVFLRIFFYNPLILKKAVDLLQSGSVLGRPFQPYEAHIPYSLQFMIDYSLYGMNFVHYSSVKFRRNTKCFLERADGSNTRDADPLRQSSQCSNASNCSLVNFIDTDEISDALLGPAELTKLISCELEIDVIASDIILDTNCSGKAMSVNPGIDSIWKDEMERRHQHGVENSSQITIPDSQDRSQVNLHHPTEKKYQQILWEKVKELYSEKEDETSYLSTSLADDSSLTPCSQVPDHLSVVQENEISEYNSHLSQEEDEFIKLLEEMAAGADVRNENFNRSCDENQVENMEEENGDLVELQEPEDVDDAIWDDSLLNSSIVEKISDIETGDEKVCSKGSGNSALSLKILQCDGQVGDSDSSSDDTPHPSTTRVSKRISEKKSKSTNPLLQKKRPDKLVKSTVTSSPGDRLSLTKRRQSRSQESRDKNSTETHLSSVKSQRQSSVRSVKDSNSSESAKKPKETVMPSSSKGDLTLDSCEDTGSFGRGRKEYVNTANTLVKVRSLQNYVACSAEMPFVSLQKIDLASLSFSGLENYTEKVTVKNNNSAESISVVHSHNNQTVVPVVRSKRIAARKMLQQSKETEDESTHKTKHATTGLSNLANSPLTQVDIGEYKLITNTSPKSKRITARSLHPKDPKNGHSSETKSVSAVTVTPNVLEALDASQSQEDFKKSVTRMSPKSKRSAAKMQYQEAEDESTNNTKSVFPSVLKSIPSELAKPILSSEIALNSKTKGTITRKILQSKKEEVESSADTKAPSIPILRSSPVELAKSSSLEKDSSKSSLSNEKLVTRPTTRIRKKRLGVTGAITSNASHVKLIGLDGSTDRLQDEPKSACEDKNQNHSNYEKGEKQAQEQIDIGVTCKPIVVTAKTQTNQLESVESSVQVSPDTVAEASQTVTDTLSIGIQSDVTRISISTQTDIVKSLCHCQCTCVVKEMQDQAVEIQNDLKPTMESRKIQVDNVDIITRARSARFTTPQNKTRRTTPLRSPDKRRSLTESPRRRNIVTPTSSRYLSALVLKTPTSHHKSKSPRQTPLTPFNSHNGGEARRGLTPPSRESKEGYLIHSMRVPSASPRKRSLHVKPRNLVVESIEDPVNNSVSKSVHASTSAALNLTTATADSLPVSTPGRLFQDAESPDCDLSVNSIYEYEEELVTPNAVTISEESPAPSSAPVALTIFQRKRIQSKHRSKSRLEKRKAANLEANRSIPDTFEIEYEPLKQPASYKSTIKWLDAEKHRFVSRKKVVRNIAEASESKSSDDEVSPPAVKLFGGGNLSDEDDENVPTSSLNTEDNQNKVKAFTPDIFLANDVNDCSQLSNMSNNETPRSILRQGGPAGNSRRLKLTSSSASLKRKIRWVDEEEPNKRIKTEPCEINNGSEDISVLTNDSLNKTADISELDGPTFKNALGLENSMSNFQDAKALHQCQFVTTMCVEVHCFSRNGLTPDPAQDPVLAIFILISSDYPENYRRPKEFLSILITQDELQDCSASEGSSGIKIFPNEVLMFEHLITLVREWDPDIFVGYEVEKSSFGYIMQRGNHLGKDMTQELSRLLPVTKKNGSKEYPRRTDEWNGTISGRIVLNLWRLLRHEISVQSYTFENAAYHILRRRVYKFTYKTLSLFWSQKVNRFKVIQYYSIRIRGAIQIMEKLDLINRTSELARLFGIQFYEVLSRGSQFRVESMMLRATKPLDFIAPSPTVMQRARMRAPEYLPLILEPRSNYYTDPVAVLDFQSLYPSMMIAYNYDYASVLGRVEHLGSYDRFSLGCLDNQALPPELLKLKDNIHISPAGVAFVNKSVVKGILPEMLEQILETRQMVKRSMKRWKNEGASLQKVLDSRQLGLKLIANVTYGYTSANFSGRMPCVEVADSIVSKGRETLQRAIDHVNMNKQRWGAEVVYGDTDSMFILFRGKSREEAFKIAYEIADEVTQANPKPVKLKFEKVYQPCILQSKKRYVGYAYETPDQEKPIYDAKGIETVRRDGCPAVRKILEKALHVLFTSNNKTSVEDYVKLQFEKLFKGRVSMQDYIFAREFRGREGYKPGACVPSLEITRRLTEHDPKAEPLVSERVPYVVIYGNPTLPLIKLVRTPEEFISNSSMRLNAHYYIEKVIIPALNRCLILAGMDATKWYLQLPRKYLRTVLEQKSKGQGTLDDYILHQNCFKCDARAERGLCSNCMADETSTVIYLQEILRNSRSKLNGCVEVCKSCSGETRLCTSVDCPVLHKLLRYDRDQAYMKNVERELQNLEW